MNPNLITLMPQMIRRVMSLTIRVVRSVHSPRIVMIVAVKHFVTAVQAARLSRLN